MQHAKRNTSCCLKIVLTAFVLFCLFHSAALAQAPSITGTNPAALPMGQNNTIEVNGTGFVNGTVILLNGSPAVTIYRSSTTVLAVLSAEPGVASPVSLVAQNPGSQGSSAAYALPLSAPSSTTAVVGTEPVRAIPGGFLGFSYEWGDGEWTMGDAARAPNYTFRQLMRNLMDSPRSPLQIRMGGGSTDQDTTPQSVEEFNELNAALPGITFTTGVILGPSLSSTPGTAETIAQAYVNGMTPGILDSIEIGNETDDYQYETTRSYTFDVYNSKYTQWTSGILQTVAPATPKFTGASWAEMRTLLNDFYWSGYVNEPPSYLQLFVNAQKAVTKTIAQHWYSGYQGGLPPSYLLGSSAMQFTNPGNPVPFWSPSVMGMAANLAHQNGMTFRVNEMNTVDGGGQPGTSDSFAAALWAVDIMFELANAGVDGVNFHGANGGQRDVTPGDTCVLQGVTYQAPCTPRPVYAPFTFTISYGPTGMLVYTLDSVNPLYYGLYFFHLAVPDGAQLLPVTVQSPNYVKVWATKDPNGTIRVAVINKDTSFSGKVSIQLPSDCGAAQTLLLADANGYTGTISYPNNTAVVGTTGITVGGQTFDGSTDGTIHGKRTTGVLTQSANDTYTVNVQPATAVLLTIGND